MSTTSIAAVIDKEKEYVVVIDAGHGGNDFGAVDNNAREKDINLNVALLLRDLISKNIRNVKVIMTRSDDTFKSLQDRANIANNAKGDLFISIHTNSVDANNKNRATVAGASVYALGLHKETNNMNVARRENSVIQLEQNFRQTYQGFDPDKDESYIIFEMAQKKNLSKSIKLANDIQQQLVSVARRKNRGVHQAGFWVLWATSMPAVLVELDFICNPESAAYLTSKQGEQQMAQSIFNAVNTYISKERSQSASQPSVSPEPPSPVSTKETSTAPQPRQRKTRSHTTTAQHPVTYYSIQICAIAEELKTTDPRFHGLSPLNVIRERNLYKYTYGESTSKAEIEKLLVQVRKNFPDAFIIETKKIPN